MRPGHPQGVPSDMFAGFPCHEPDLVTFYAFTAITFAGGAYIIVNRDRWASPRVTVYAWAVLYSAYLAVVLVYGCWFGAIYTSTIRLLFHGVVAGSASIPSKIFDALLLGLFAAFLSLLLLVWLAVVFMTARSLVIIWRRKEAQGIGTGVHKGEKDLVRPRSRSTSRSTV
ncbi:hypothetical protein QBC33DRAFT_557869 [Phialemonium atrogriseum]|uniref:Uncharacterized protein n=1 Tax=Phialemonium atrogriseum TaxID=1093897 RepID=A0AAJ0C3H6_9PEZI|nr:uncharacterized protein QBC33DRAFT_557869 [Phialemonium atrogriseum]KAK1768408.1 hypothetical protein QBC33DRAFT_557869 [Phialemonium atrogriseum]